jgi:hypothetical protein
MNFNTYDLFPTQVCGIKIDPSTYNKEEIIKIVTDNYNKSNFRNKWDRKSNLHHYYNDWDNPEFEELPLDLLLDQYSKVFDNFFRQSKFKKSKFDYRYSIVNVTAGEDNITMSGHEHFSRNGGFETMYSCVHYVSFKDGHMPTTFINPLIFGQYTYNLMNAKEVLDMNDSQNSTFSYDYMVPTEEDKMIIFPSYLFHNVSKAHKSTSNIRITVVCNLDVKLLEFSQYLS